MKTSLFVTLFTTATAVIAGSPRAMSAKGKTACINSCINNVKALFTDYNECVAFCTSECDRPVESDKSK